MRSGKLWAIIFVIGLIFIGMGDSFLPKPLSTASKITRTQINNVILKKLMPKNIHRPSLNREKQLDNFENQAELHQNRPEKRGTP